MDWLLGAALSNAAVTAAAVVVLLPLLRVVRRPALTHAVCLLILVKLLTPPLWRVPLAWLPPDAASTQRATAGAGTERGGDAAVAAAGEHTAAGVAPAASRVRPARADQAEGARGGAAGRWRRLAFAVWVAGSGFCCAVTLLRLRRLRRLLRFARAAPPEDQQRVRALAARLGLSHCPPLLVLPGGACPMLFGLLSRPRLYVSSDLWDRLAPPQRDAMLLHELAHYRRRDHLVRLIELLAAVVYWWDPAAWWVRGELREAEEQCCDAWVLAGEPSAAHDYATALLEVIDFAARTRAVVPALASGMGEFHNLQRRLVMVNVMRQRQSGWTLSRFGALGVCVAAALLLPLAPVLAQKPPAQKAPAGEGGAGAPAAPAAPDAGRPAGGAGESARPDPSKGPASPPRGGAGKPPRGAGGPATRTAQDEQKALEAKLGRVLPEVDFNKVGFADAIDFLRDVSGANIYVSWESLDAVGVDRNAPVTARLKNVKFSDALKTLLSQVEAKPGTLHARPEKGVVVIFGTPPESLVLFRYDLGKVQAAAAQKAILESVDPKSWVENGGSLGMIKVEGGRLVVVQTEKNQEETSELLTRMRLAAEKTDAPGR